MTSATYLVLGATGGMGRVLCERLSKQGAALVVGGRDADRLGFLGQLADLLDHLELVLGAGIDGEPDGRAAEAQRVAEAAEAERSAYVHSLEPKYVGLYKRCLRCTEAYLPKLDKGEKQQLQELEDDLRVTFADVVRWRAAAEGAARGCSRPRGPRSRPPDRPRRRRWRAPRSG